MTTLDFLGNRRFRELCEYIFNSKNEYTKLYFICKLCEEFVSENDTRLKTYSSLIIEFGNISGLSPAFIKKTMGIRINATTIPKSYRTMIEAAEVLRGLSISLN